MGDSLLDIRGDQEGAPLTQPCLEFRKEDVYPSQIEIPEVHIGVRDGLKKGDQITRLGIAGNE